MERSQFDKLDENGRQSFLDERRLPEHKEEIISENMLLVKKMIADSVSSDTFMIQSINSIEELDKVCNTLTKRIREWYGYYFPEMNYLIQDNEEFIRKVIEKSKESFMAEKDIKISMGPELSQKDIDAIIDFARQVSALYSQRERIMKYLEDVMKSYCPNILALTGAMIAAKLLEKAGSLRQLSRLPSSTIQLLGAEQALFRHLRNKRIRPPKHGFILSHPLVGQAKNKGQAARMLAAKISIASKIDYFKGEFLGDKLLREVEVRFS